MFFILCGHSKYLAVISIGRRRRKYVHLRQFCLKNNIFRDSASIEKYNSSNYISEILERFQKIWYLLKFMQWAENGDDEFVSSSLSVVFRVIKFYSIDENSEGSYSVHHGEFHQSNEKVEEEKSDVNLIRAILARCVPLHRENIKVPDEIRRK